MTVTTAAMGDQQELDYRNLVHCRIEIGTLTGSSQPAVRLPQDCYNAANTPLPVLYDFALGMSFLALTR